MRSACLSIVVSSRPTASLLWLVLMAQPAWVAAQADLDVDDLLSFRDWIGRNGSDTVEFAAIVAFIMALYALIMLLRSYWTGYFQAIRTGISHFPRLFSGVYTIISWFIVAFLVFLAFAEPLVEADFPYEGNNRDVQELALIRGTFVFASIMLIFGPIFIFVPTHPFVVTRKVLDKIAACLNSETVQYMLAAAFTVLAAFHLFVMYAFYRVLTQRFGVAFGVAFGALAFYSVLVVFNTMAFFKAVTGKEYPLDGIHVIKELRRQLTVIDGKDSPEKFLNQDAYKYFYGFMGLFSFLAGAGLILLHAVRGDDLTDDAEIIWIVGIVAQVILLVVCLVFAARALFKPETIEVMDVNGKFVWVDHILNTTIYRRSDRTPLFEFMNPLLPGAIQKQIRNTLWKVVNKSPDTPAYGVNTPQATEGMFTMHIHAPVEDEDEDTNRILPLRVKQANDTHSIFYIVTAPTFDSHLTAVWLDALHAQVTKTYYGSQAVDMFDIYAWSKDNRFMTWARKTLQYINEADRDSRDDLITEYATHLDHWDAVDDFLLRQRKAVNDKSSPTWQQMNSPPTFGLESDLTIQAFAQVWERTFSSMQHDPNIMNCKDMETPEAFVNTDGADPHVHPLHASADDVEAGLSSEPLASSAPVTSYGPTAAHSTPARVGLRPAARMTRQDDDLTEVHATPTELASVVQHTSVALKEQSMRVEDELHSVRDQIAQLETKVISNVGKYDAIKEQLRPSFSASEEADDARQRAFEVQVRENQAQIEYLKERADDLSERNKHIERKIADTTRELIDRVEESRRSLMEEIPRITMIKVRKELDNLNQEVQEELRQAQRMVEGISSQLTEVQNTALEEVDFNTARVQRGYRILGQKLHGMKVPTRMMPTLDQRNSLAVSANGKYVHSAVPCSPDSEWQMAFGDLPFYHGFNGGDAAIEVTVERFDGAYLKLFAGWVCDVPPQTDGRQALEAEPPASLQDLCMLVERPVVGYVSIEGVGYVYEAAPNGCLTCRRVGQAVDEGATITLLLWDTGDGNESALLIAHNGIFLGVHTLAGRYRAAFPMTASASKLTTLRVSLNRRELMFGDTFGHEILTPFCSFNRCNDLIATTEFHVTQLNDFMSSLQGNQSLHTVFAAAACQSLINLIVTTLPITLGAMQGRKPLSVDGQREFLQRFYLCERAFHSQVLSELEGQLRENAPYESEISFLADILRVQLWPLQGDAHEAIVYLAMNMPSAPRTRTFEQRLVSTVESYLQDIAYILEASVVRRLAHSAMALPSHRRQSSVEDPKGPYGRRPNKVTPL